MTSNFYTWKEVSSPVKDPSVLTFQRSEPLIQTSRQDIKSSANSFHIGQQFLKSFKNNNNSAQFSPIREVGYIEKLLHSYGFIQCCNRQNRLFFHFSEVVGRPESFQVGDIIEFQQSHDKRTGKSVASSITKVQEMAPNSIGMTAVTGVVLSPIKEAEDGKSTGMGQIAYEQNGETFFIPFSHPVAQSARQEAIKAGDCVEFFICTEDSGTIQAKKIKKLFKSSTGNKEAEADGTAGVGDGGEVVAGQGVVCSMKENFGFIERADVVKEIFFHFTEFDGKMADLSLGEDVEFSIETKNHKEVAVAVKKLPEGTVIFEDVADEKLVGQVSKALHLTAAEMCLTSDPVFGRILYQSLAGALEILYGERDRVGDFTLLVGDLVEFHVATDRRDKLQRATNIKVLDASFSNTCEKRHQGFVISVNDYSGFICSTSSNYKMLFHITELLDPLNKLTFLDEVEFSIAEDISECKVAIRIKKLLAGTIEKTWKPEKYFGVVRKRSERAASTETDHFEPGVLKYEEAGQELMVAYFPSAVIHGCRLPIVGDLVEFQISKGPNKEAKVAANIKLKDAEIKRTGFVADIKDGAVWIELIGQTDLISFKSTLINSSFHLLKVGDEIEFVCSSHSIDNICLLADGSIPYECCLPRMMEGRVVRCINSSENCDTDNYCGLIQLLDKNQSNNATFLGPHHHHPLPNTLPNSLPNTLPNPLPNTLPNPLPNTLSNPLPNTLSNTAHLLLDNDEVDKKACIKDSLLDKDTDGGHQAQCCRHSGTLYSFRICSLIDRRDVPCLGELVRFQPIDNSLLNGKHLPNKAICGTNNKSIKAGMVVSLKRCLHARVATLNSKTGTLNYQLSDASALPFHIADVVGAEAGVFEGDLIEYVAVSKNNEFSAVGLYKLSCLEKQGAPRPDRMLKQVAPRPDRLVSRLRSDDSFHSLVATRQPKGPEAGKGFSHTRTSSRRLQQAPSPSLVHAPC